MQSTDLPAVAQTEMQKITEQHIAAQKDATRAINRSLRIFLIGILAIAGMNYLLNRYVVPDQVLSEPSISLSVVVPEENPLLCPGDTLRHLLTLDIREPTVVTLDTNVRNMDTGGVEILSTTVRAIYDDIERVALPANWIIPMKLPATNIQPERNWRPGQYRRLVALTGVEGDKRASVVAIDFRIKAGCNP